jgi:hypothetical protein
MPSIRSQCNVTPSLRAPILRAALVLCLLAKAWAAPVSADRKKPLQVYFVDVEGGQATLFVTPAH